MRNVLAIRCVLAALVFCVAGCQGPSLPKAPNLYRVAGATAWESLDPEHRTCTADILYATDRARVKNDDPTAAPEYGFQRSHSLAVGRAVVRFGEEEMTWDSLMTASCNDDADEVALALVSVEEFIRFPTSASPLVMIDDELAEDPAVLADTKRADELVRAELARRLEQTSRKEAFIYIHGVANQFANPMIRMAQLWHYLGRAGVPIVYTWPAGGGGVLRGYTYDRESSEFTIYHLREFLRLVASSPELERIHILSHSRGTDVIMSALRDLQLQYRAQGLDAREELKLGNLILAAPDIDWELAQQRFRPDLVHLMPERMTIYVSQSDDAIGIADWLFKSAARLGRLGRSSMSEGQRQMLIASAETFDIIDIRTGSATSHGHSYMIDDPAVFSDVILILRDDRSPGAQFGRPLERTKYGFWVIRKGYPHRPSNAAGGKDPAVAAGEVTR